MPTSSWIAFMIFSTGVVGSTRKGIKRPQGCWTATCVYTQGIREVTRLRSAHQSNFLHHGIADSNEKTQKFILTRSFMILYWNELKRGLCLSIFSIECFVKERRKNRVHAPCFVKPSCPGCKIAQYKYCNTMLTFTVRVQLTTMAKCQRTKRSQKQSIVYEFFTWN